VEGYVFFTVTFLPVDIGSQKWFKYSFTNRERVSSVPSFAVIGSGSVLLKVAHNPDSNRVRMSYFDGAWKILGPGWRSSTVEQLICNQQVVGSSPIASSRQESCFEAKT
jgi:hypothetical protein